MSSYVIGHALRRVNKKNKKTGIKTTYKMMVWNTVQDVQRIHYHYSHILLHIQILFFANLAITMFFFPIRRIFEYRL